MFVLYVNFRSFGLAGIGVCGFCLWIFVVSGSSTSSMFIFRGSSRTFVVRCDVRCEMWVIWDVGCQWCGETWCVVWAMFDVRCEWCGEMMSDVRVVVRLMCDVSDVICEWLDVRCDRCGEMWCEMWQMWWDVMWDVSDVVGCDVVGCEMLVMWWDLVVLKLRNSDEISTRLVFYKKKCPELISLHVMMFLHCLGSLAGIIFCGKRNRTWVFSSVPRHRHKKEIKTRGSPTTIFYRVVSEPEFF